MVAEWNIWETTGVKLSREGGTRSFGLSYLGSGKEKNEKLDENWYIVPGLGDMGDRLFGTT